LRHTFCYYAGLYNIPLVIVQAVVGHMSPEMTKHYSMHATHKEIKESFRNMPNLLNFSQPTEKQLPASKEPERDKLAELVQVADIKKIQKAIKLLEG